MYLALKAIQFDSVMQPFIEKVHFSDNRVQLMRRYSIRIFRHLRSLFLVNLSCISGFVWQRYMNSHKLRGDDTSKPSKEELEQRVSEMVPAKTPDKQDN